MSLLTSLLDSCGLRYFCSGDELLLIFRGERLDHYVLLREAPSFVHATCVIGRAPIRPDAALALRLLEWNASHSLARAAIGQGELLLLADLPRQGLQAAGLRELLLSVATAAEELGDELISLLLNVGAEGRPLILNTGGTGSPRAAAAGGTGGDVPGGAVAVPGGAAVVGGEPRPPVPDGGGTGGASEGACPVEAEDPDIDWETS